MKTLSYWAVICVAGVGIGAGMSACDKGEAPQVKIVDEEAEAKKRAADEAAAEDKRELSAREAYETRKKARENQPEPKLNPEEPREKFDLVFKKGKTRIRSFQKERADILGNMKNLTFDDKKYGESYGKLVKRLESWALSSKKAHLETAAEELCELIVETRPQADAMIAEGTAEVTRIDAEIKALEAEQEAGKTVYQRKWDKVEDERKRWQQPLKGGQFVYLAYKSMFDEALVLAEWGPRRAQLTLRDCLGAINKTPMPSELAQTNLDKVISRSKWYRDLR